MVLGRKNFDISYSLSKINSYQNHIENYVNMNKEQEIGSIEFEGNIDDIEKILYKTIKLIPRLGWENSNQFKQVLYFLLKKH